MMEHDGNEDESLDRNDENNHKLTFEETMVHMAWWEDRFKVSGKITWETDKYLNNNGDEVQEFAIIFYKDRSFGFTVKSPTTTAEKNNGHE